jgi:diguanylate cyclase (GGDEF)-like protein
MDPSSLTGIGVALLASAVIGALLGAAGHAALVSRRQLHRVARLLDHLASSAETGHDLDTRGIHDRRLRMSVDVLAASLADTWTLASTDPLTGTLSRQALLARLADEIERAERYRRNLSIVLIDLDHFKQLNDGYGHAAGDQVLHEVAGLLCASVRAVDVVGRYGGEEFMVVLPETDTDAAATLAEKLRRVAEAHSAAVGDGHKVGLTISAGVATAVGGHTIDLLIRDADAALYTAKALGRNKVYVFRDSGEGGLVRRAPIEATARELAVAVGRSAMLAAREALTDALNARRASAGRPSTLVAEMTDSLGRALGLPESEVERLRTASLLHDLGTLAVPEDILVSQGELGIRERRVMSEHPRIGQVVLEQAGALRDAATIVLHHHERFDGRGYPYGLAGHEIPVGARIVAVADAYEAMVAGRPYRPALSHGQALAELQAGAGSQFDPEIVDLVVTLFADGVPWSPATAGERPRDPAVASSEADAGRAGVDDADREPSPRAPSGRPRAGRTLTHARARVRDTPASHGDP